SVAKVVRLPLAASPAAAAGKSLAKRGKVVIWGVGAFPGWPDSVTSILASTSIQGANGQRIVEPEGAFVRHRLDTENVGRNRHSDRGLVSVPTGTALRVRRRAGRVSGRGLRRVC